MINNRKQRRAKSTTKLDRRRVKRSTASGKGSGMNNKGSSFKFPKVRSNIDLMPILTSSGDGVFEVGLNHAIAPLMSYLCLDFPVSTRR